METVKFFVILCYIDICIVAKYQSQVIAKLPSNRRTNPGRLDPSWTQIRKTKENNWIKSLHTAFPYGLKDNIGEKYHLHTTDISSSAPRSHYILVMFL